MNDGECTKYLIWCVNNMSTAQQPTANLDDDDVGIIEPDYISLEDLDRIRNEVILPFPFDTTGAPIDRTNENIPGALKLSESSQMLKDYITEEGFGDHHIQVYDNWIRNAGVNVYNRMVRLTDGRVACFENLQISQPSYTRDGKVLPLTPKL